MLISAQPGLDPQGYENIPILYQLSQIHQKIQTH
jgi:hypothetical protein